MREYTITSFKETTKFYRVQIGWLYLYIRKCDRLFQDIFTSILLRQNTKMYSSGWEINGTLYKIFQYRCYSPTTKKIEFLSTEVEIQNGK